MDGGRLDRWRVARELALAFRIQLFFASGSRNDFAYLCRENA
jgi:hypothetical protein